MFNQSEIVIDQEYAGLNPVQFGGEECAPLHDFGPAIRSHWLLHYVRSGKGIFVRDGVTHHVRAGEIFVIPPFVRTYYQADATDPWKYVWVGFTATGNTPAVFDTPVIRNPRAGAVFDRMERCARLGQGRSAYLSACLWELAEILLESGTDSADYADMAISYIRSEYMEDHLSVAEIAGKLNINRSYFCALFKERTGRSPQQYILDVRMSRAAELMTLYGESVTVAANSVGYPDICLFSKMFKRRFGVSPREYKRQNTAI